MRNKNGELLYAASCIECYSRPLHMERGGGLLFDCEEGEGRGRMVVSCGMVVCCTFSLFPLPSLPSFRSSVPSPLTSSWLLAPSSCSLLRCSARVCGSS